MIKRAVLLLIIMSFLSRVSWPAEIHLGRISLPSGFTIHVYGRNIPDARSLARGDKGTIFVGSRKRGNVYALVDKDGDFRADEVITVASGLHMPNGIAFKGGDLYVAELKRIVRFPQIENNLRNPPEPVTVYEGLPEKTHHGWKYLGFGPDNLLYFTLGVPCNVCRKKDRRFGTIMRINPDGGTPEIYARGIRNSVGFDFNPATGVLWFTDNGRDWLGDDSPPDELNRVQRNGLHFGFPECHGMDIPDPIFGREGSCEKYTPPVLEMGAHVAPLGLRFYRGKMFPPSYWNQIFIAEHGSWNRTIPVGYRILLVTHKGGKVLGKRVFAKGWLEGGKSWGRPVDLLNMPDGSLLLSDDKSGTVYRIFYSANNKGVEREQ